MLKAKRQYVPEVTRSGGRPSKVQFTIRCSECSDRATFESKGLVADDAVSHWFRQKGWLLGRNSRSFDICPACLAVEAGARSVQHPAAAAPGALTHSSAQRMNKDPSMSKPEDDTDRLIARHFGKPRQTRQDPGPSSPAESRRPDDRAGTTASRDPKALVPSKPAQSQDERSLQRVLASIASDIESLRAAVFVMVEQVGRIVSMQMEQTGLQKEAVTAQKQQVEAIARLAPLLVRSAEGVSGSVREAIAGIRTAVERTDATTLPDERTIVRSAATREPEAMAAKRPRGRPRKNPLPEMRLPNAGLASSPDVPVAKRPRGRPRKNPEAGTEPRILPEPAARTTASAASGSSIRSNPVQEGAAKRPRGRPRKHPLVDDASGPAPSRSTASSEPVPTARRPRGRPRKPSATATPSLVSKPGATTSRGLDDSRISWEKKAWSRHASVTSQSDRSSQTRFTTVIQMKRKDWDLAGFRPDEALAIERSRNEVTITRARTGGVRAAKVGATRVEIRAKTLGNLTFTKVKLDANKDAIVLKGSRV